MDIDKYIERVKKCDILEETEVIQVCKMMKEILLEEPNVLNLSSPITVIGDLHAQFHDMLDIFRRGGKVKETKYLFLGDYVNRGYHSIETFTYLALLKIKYPQQIHLLRGNHECQQITQIYGLYDEIVKIYGNERVWKFFCEVFDHLPISAVISNRVFCVHAGLSPDFVSIDQLQTIDRAQEIPIEGVGCDIFWSDPEEIETWNVSCKGSGWLYGHRVVKEFFEINNLKLMIRSHQVCQEGYRYHFREYDAPLITIFSAPNYCYRCGNKGGFVKVKNEEAEVELVTYIEVEENRKISFLKNDPAFNYFV